jgi:translocation and assembly module TamA
MPLYERGPIQRNIMAVEPIVRFSEPPCVGWSTWRSLLRLRLPMAESIRHCVLLLLAVALGAAFVHAARAADPQPYTVNIEDTGNKALNAALKQTSGLVGLREKAPVGPFPLITRARQDGQRLKTVLHSFGYYKGNIAILINGRPLNDPSLPARLARTTGSATVSIAVNKGPQFHLRHVTIEGDMPEDDRAKLGLAPGQPAVAADVLAARERLLTALQEDGFALAKIEPPVAIEHADANALDVTFKVTTGPRLHIGPIAITGLKTVNESFIRKRLLINPGELYQPSRIDAARRDLAALDIIGGVTVRAADKPGPDGRLPLTFKIDERPERTVGVTGAYSTDLGGRLKLTWAHRNLFGNAERLELSGAATGLGGTTTNGLGYDLSARLTKPDFLRRDQSLQTGIEALQQDLDAYSQRAFKTGASIRRRLSSDWSTSVGLSAEQERIKQEGVTRDYTLVGLPGTLDFDSTGAAPLADPTHGWRAQLGGTPTMPFGPQASVFGILQASASTYVDIGSLWSAAPGRSVLAFRALVGSIVGADQLDVPPDQRFYGGGSATVRGYAFQSIGPKFPDGKPIGGTAIDAATVEFRQRLFGDFGMAAFVDAGQVGDSAMPFDGTPRVGVGIGGRYYTAIGPIRLDVALPLDKPQGGDSFELYIGIGQAF